MQNELQSVVWIHNQLFWQKHIQFMCTKVYIARQTWNTKWLSCALYWH